MYEPKAHDSKYFIRLRLDNIVMTLVVTKFDGTLGVTPAVHVVIARVIEWLWPETSSIGEESLRTRDLLKPQKRCTDHNNYF